MKTKEIRSGLLREVDQLSNLVGNTPLRYLKSDNPSVRIAAKLEWYQIGHSVKARAAYAIFKHAIESGFISTERYLLDASSGNTGIAYAALGAYLNIPVKICLPENAGLERKQILKYFGAEIELTSPFESTDGAQLVAAELAQKEPGKYFYADQYSNKNNWKAHYRTTAKEIWKQTSGKITHLVVGLGTTGTLTGTARRLKELNPEIRIIGLQPDMAMHGLEGWKHLETARVPAIYDNSLVDDIRYIKTEEAYEALIRLSRDQGLNVSPSAAANYVGAKEVANELREGFVVTVFPDNSDKYGEVINQLL